jgi:signal transduction histidine kinase
MESVEAIAALDALPSEVAVLDADGVITYTNRAWREFGVENDNPIPGCIGMSYLEVCDAASDDPLTATIAAGIRDLLAGDREFFTTVYPCHSPTRRRWFSLQAFPVEMGEGLGRQIMLVHSDVMPGGDREARAEVERLSVLAGVLTHDLTNSLSVARGYLALLSEEIDSPYLGPLTQAVERMTAITEAAGLVARQGAVTEFDEVDVGLLARRTWLGLEPEPATIEVHEVGVIEADEDLLRMLFENLFRNAVEHAGERVHVAVGPLDDGDGFYVADDGPGIPLDLRAEVFKAGFTTETADTGLGLALVARIASAHGWEVRVTDANSGGARIEITGVTR